MEIRAGFEPAYYSFADCSLANLSTVSYLVICAGLEPSITALKGLCPDRLDEQTILRRSDPPHLIYNENIINADIKQCRKNN